MITTQFSVSRNPNSSEYRERTGRQYMVTMEKLGASGRAYSTQVLGNFHTRAVANGVASLLHNGNEFSRLRYSNGRIVE